MATASRQTERPAMKPEAPPSSKAVRMTWLNSANGTPAERTAHGRSRIEASRRHPLGEPGYSSLSRSMSRSLRARAASMIASSRARPQLVARQRVDEVLDDHGHAGGAAVVDHLLAD